MRALLLLSLTACAARVPPHLWPEPIPPLPVAEPLVWELAGDDCPAPIAYLPGQPAPHVEGGLVTCRAVLVPEARVAELLRLEADAEMWRATSELLRIERERDRRRCQAEYDQAWVAARDASAQLRSARILELSLIAACVASHAVR